MNTPVRSRLDDAFGAALVHPICLIGMAVWWLNDHVGKRYAPSVATGKLSDVACLVVFPVFVWCLLDGLASLLFRQSYANQVRRRAALFRLTTLAIVAWFVAIKVSEPVGAIHRQLWSNVYTFLAVHLQTVGLDWQRAAHHTVDPTDVLALPSVALAYYVVSSHLRQVCSSDADAGAVTQLNET